MSNVRKGIRNMRGICVLVVVLGALVSATAGEIHSGRLYTVPAKLYVNQAFEIRFELTVTAGCDIEQLNISDFPTHPEIITVGQLEPTTRNRISRDGQLYDVLYYTASARCHKPLDRTFAPSVHGMLVVRRSTGFFSYSQSQAMQQKLDPFGLRVLPLPAIGRPEHFSGAIGNFYLKGSISQTHVQPGDIVTLSLELVGQGWLTDVVLPALQATPLYKMYPVKERERTAMRIITDQVLIPQSTNATEIAAVSISFFNPVTERYEASVAGPFHLTFGTGAPLEKAEIRVLDPIRGAAPSDAQTVIFERINLMRQQIFSVLIAGVGVLAAFFLFFLLRSKQPWLAVLLVLLVLGLGLGVGYAFRAQQSVVSICHVTQRAEVRFAPGDGAMTLFTLNPGTVVTPLERKERWLRIDAASRRGWIASEAITFSGQ